MTCEDCLYRAMCYKHEHYGYEDEKPCETFKNKADFVEVVRCKDCQWYDNGVCQNPRIYISDSARLYTDKTDFCSYGEKGNTHKSIFQLYIN